MKAFICYVLIINSFTLIIGSAQENTNVFTYKVGAFEVSLLSEGQQSGKTGILVGATPEMIQKCIPDV